MIHLLAVRSSFMAFLVIAIGIFSGPDLATAAAKEFEPVTVPMQVTQVAPHSYYVLGQA